MKKVGTLEVTTPSDREIRMVREFDAPRMMVWDALTEPEMIKEWLLGPPGWTMVVCDVDLIVAGAYRYVWRSEQGKEMGMGGFYREISPPERLVVTESFDEAWYPGQAVNTTALKEKGGKTTLTLTVKYDSKEARDKVMKSEMTEGLSANYDELDALLASRLTQKHS